METVKLIAALLVVFSIRTIAFPGDTPKGGEHEVQPTSGPGAGSGQGGRKKRAIDEHAQLWPEATVHWEIAASQANQLGFQKAVKYIMAMFEYYTVIRFVEKPSGYTGPYAIYNCTGSAASMVGRYGNGQKVKCCSWQSCSHEFGHMLGMVHEHFNTERDAFLQMLDPTEAKPAYINEYYRRAPGAYRTYGYFDYASMMLYDSRWDAADPGQRMYRFFDNDVDQVQLQYMWGTYWLSYYPAMELSDRYNATKYCPGFTATCQNKGYLTKLGDTCQCRCPTGLSSSSNCVAEEATDTSGDSLTWPTASFVLLAPKSGCPPGFHSDGYVKHESNKNIKLSNTFNADSTISYKWITNKFCARDSTAGTASFDKGFYCIYKGSGSCPTGFEESSIQFEDKAGSTTEKSSENIPDGEYGDNTLFKFCCRMDGYHQRPISLPISDNFILFPIVDKCQEVKGMQARMEYYWFKTGGIATTTGLTPFTASMYKLHYCHYTPKQQECGGVIELSDTNTQATIQSPNYPSNYPDNKMCTWFIKVASGTDAKILLDFTDFDIHKHTSRECIDSVEVRHSLPGNGGMKYCGNLRPPSLVSQFDTMVVYLRSDHSTNAKGFEATAKLLKPDSLCYKNNGTFGSYSGDVSTTRLHHSCVPWSAAKKCSHHAFNEGDRQQDLRENYCRNPGDGDRPWCYTSAEMCLRDYCDVCAKEQCRDSVADCSSDSCSNTFEGEDKLCAQTCVNCPADNSVASCPAPPSIAGTTLSGASGTYNLGDKITYMCNSDTRHILSQWCSSSGAWKPDVNFVCGACPNGYDAIRGICYKFMDDFVTFDTAVATCALDQAEVSYDVNPRVGVSAEKIKTAQYSPGQKAWITRDCYDTTKSQWDKRMWYTGTTSTAIDGTPCQSWTKTSYWADEFPDASVAAASNYCRNPSFDNEPWCFTATGWKYCGIPACTAQSSCVAVNGNGEVSNPSCSDKLPYTCAFSPSERPVCSDQDNDCDNKLEASPTMCVDYPDFAWQRCARTCGRCSDSKPNANVDCFDKSTSWNKAMSYTGTKSTAIDGTTCESWTGSGYVAAEFPDASVEAANNYCRNPSFDAEPWCFIATGWKFCGIPDCTPVTCTLPGASANSVQVGSESVLSIGEYVQYTCNSGHVHTAGSLLRACKQDGQLTSSEPVCSDVSTTNWWTDTVTEIRDRDQTTTKEKIFFSDNDHYRIAASGTISQWRFYARNADIISLVVMRKVTDTTHTVIGVNRITPKGDRMETVDIAAADQISVQSGDLIGAFTRSTDSGVTYDTCSVTKNPTYGGVMETKGYIWDAINEVGKTKGTRSVTGCRTLSVSAFVTVSSSGA